LATSSSAPGEHFSSISRMRSKHSLAGMLTWCRNLSETHISKKLSIPHVSSSMKLEAKKLRSDVIKACRDVERFTGPRNCQDPIRQLIFDQLANPTDWAISAAAMGSTTSRPSANPPFSSITLASLSEKLPSSAVRTFVRHPPSFPASLVFAFVLERQIHPRAKSGDFAVYDH
jgi:hypothetical protein